MEAEWNSVYHTQNGAYETEPYEAETALPPAFIPAKRPPVTEATVATIFDAGLATLTAVIGLTLFADSKVLAPAASGTFLLMVGVIRLLIAGDHWFHYCGNRQAEARDEALVAEAAAQEVARLAAVASEATAAADAERAAAAERLARAERLADAERSAAADRLAEAEAMTNRLAKADAECADLARRLNESRADLQAAGVQTRRLREAGHLHTARCLRLAARLAVSRRRQRLAYAEVCAKDRKCRDLEARDQQKELAEFAALSPQRSLSLPMESGTPSIAALLREAQPLLSAEAAEELGCKWLSSDAAAEVVPQKVELQGSHAIPISSEPLVLTQTTDAAATPVPDGRTPVAAPWSLPLGEEAQPAHFAAHGASCMPESLGNTAANGTTDGSTAANCSATTDTVLAKSTAAGDAAAGSIAAGDAAAGSASVAAATASRSDLIARLTKMAAGNPELRESLRERLKSTISGGATGNDTASNAAAVSQSDHAAGVIAATPVLPEAARSAVTTTDVVQQAAPATPATVAMSTSALPEAAASGSVRAEIVTKIHDLAAANDDLRAEWRARGEALCEATRDAASMRELAAEQSRELSHLRARRDALELQVSEVSAELRATRQLAAAREVFEPVSRGPELSFNWVEGAWDWPGGAASRKGAEKLRRSVGSRSAELSVGPPPADWRTWLQLGLRRGQPSDPALLRLAVPGAEDSAYIGLMWTAPAA